MKAVKNRSRSWGIASLVPLVLGMVVLGGCADSATDIGPSPGDESATVAREIEEADIVKYEDGHFYLANAYTGLRIIDARDMDQPELLGRLPLGGKTVEMFLRDEFAFVLTSAQFGCAGRPVQFDDQLEELVSPDYEGSRLWVIDVSDKQSPRLVSALDTEGFVAQTRRVGEVIYLAGNSSSGTDAFITSVNIADPQAAFLVENTTFEGHTLDIHVSQNAVYVLGEDREIDETTLVTYVDITDPAGDIDIRDQFRVPGLVQNRFFADEYEGTFRIITDELDQSSFVRRVALYVYDVSDPDDVTRLAELPIITNESLRTVRFSGERGYAVTFQRIDPLFVLDLSDPASPKVTGELEVPGWSTHLVPLDDRLIGVGFDDASGFRPAVALYDVSDAANPRQLARVVLGGFDHYSVASEATVDEKALKVIPEAGLILLPFSVLDLGTGRHVDSLQIVRLQSDTLYEKGAVAHEGLVRRADMLDDRVWILSDLSFQTIDIDDLDEPTTLGLVQIIDDQTLLDAGLTNCVDSARTRGTPVGVFFDSAPDEFFLGGLLQFLIPFILFGL